VGSYKVATAVDGLVLPITAQVVAVVVATMVVVVAVVDRAVLLLAMPAQAVRVILVV
jgi:hypothetical protein